MTLGEINISIVESFDEILDMIKLRMFLSLPIKQLDESYCILTGAPSLCHDCGYCYQTELEHHDLCERILGVRFKGIKIIDPRNRYIIVTSEKDQERIILNPMSDTPIVEVRPGLLSKYSLYPNAIPKRMSNNYRRMHHVPMKRTNYRSARSLYDPWSRFVKK